jgi:hypothetical protein
VRSTIRPGQEALVSTGIEYRCNNGTIKVAAKDALLNSLADHPRDDRMNLIPLEIVGAFADARSVLLKIHPEVWRQFAVVFGGDLENPFQLFDEVHAVIVDKRIDLSGDLALHSLHHFRRKILFAGEMRIDGFFAHSEIGCDFIHRDRAEAVEKEMFLCLFKDSVPYFDF